MWDTCNSIIIAWTTNSMFESIGKSIFNGSRKYKINKDIYEVKQNHDLEELEDMNELPKISIIIDEITMFLQAVTKQKEEQKTQRSHLLLMYPLPSVKTAKSQREILIMKRLDIESTSLYNRIEDKRNIKNIQHGILKARKIFKKGVIRDIKMLRANIQIFGKALGRETGKEAGKVLEVDVYPLCSLTYSHKGHTNPVTIVLLMKFKGIGPNYGATTTQTKGDVGLIIPRSSKTKERELCFIMLGT
ncbi:hypothetical protein Cgig2_009135 [Carnegiea gigantea]|uniref:Uncharacterized protein n=1 Tax=Carnegiea gigantea TaxID=171969 RepID=A0A9Q1Q9P2_9CARY|nr:hypothetical protein Cgig2_009135 [Carnegiea gigantea]